MHGSTANGADLALSVQVRKSQSRRRAPPLSGLPRHLTAVRGICLHNIHCTISLLSSCVFIKVSVKTRSRVLFIVWTIRRRSEPDQQKSVLTGTAHPRKGLDVHFAKSMKQTKCTIQANHKFYVLFNFETNFSSIMKFSFPLSPCTWDIGTTTLRFKWCPQHSAWVARSWSQAEEKQSPSAGTKWIKEVLCLWVVTQGLRCQGVRLTRSFRNTTCNQTSGYQFKFLCSVLATHS